MNWLFKTTREKATSAVAQHDTHDAAKKLHEYHRTVANLNDELISRNVRLQKLDLHLGLIDHAISCVDRAEWGEARQQMYALKDNVKQVVAEAEQKGLSSVVDRTTIKAALD